MTETKAACDDHWLREDVEHLSAYLNLSHELRTPANAVLGHVELLLAGSAGPLTWEVRESLSDIQRAALVLSTRIDDIVKCAERLSVPRSVPFKEQ